MQRKKGVRQSTSESNSLPDKEALVLAGIWNDKLAAELNGLEGSFRDSPSVPAAKYDRIVVAITSLSNDIGVVSTTLTYTKVSELKEALLKAPSTADAASPIR